MYIIDCMYVHVSLLAWIKPSQNVSCVSLTILSWLFGFK